MGIKTLIGSGIGLGLGALASSLFTPTIPANAHTFTASNDGKCEVRQEGRQTPYSWLRGKLGDYSNSNDPEQRVVRVYETNGRYTTFGTGYVLDDGFVLTANHVTDGMKQPIISNEKHGDVGHVLAADSKTDLALINIPINGKFKPTRIGNVNRGEGVTIRTLDTQDWFYSSGSKSLREVRQSRYNGQISSPDYRQVQELEKMYFTLEQKINELGSEMDTLMKPYFPESETEIKVREGGTARSLQDSSPTKRLIEELNSDPNAYHFIGKTKDNRPAPGMSGSGVFNERGELVGMAVRIERTVSGYGTSTIYGFGYTKDMPDELIEKLERINEQRNALGGEKNKIESNIYHLLNPVIDTDVAVSPSAIVSFLKSYCNSTEVQPQVSAMQFSGNSNRIEESLEQTLKLYPELDTPAYRRTFLEQFNQ